MRRSWVVLAYVLSLVVTPWVWYRRRMYRRRGAALTAAEREALAPYFDGALLDRVVVARVPHIVNPVAVCAMMPLGFKPPMDLRNLWGMAFCDTVVLTGKCGEDRGCSVLFHEMVHVAQYRVMGTRRFLGAYILDWLTNGRNYWRICFEEQAFGLQRRFGRGLAGREAFLVEDEVRGLIGR